MLGVAYNVFDAVDLLEASIDTVRPVADFVCVVYQDVSNFGEPMSDQDRYFMDRLRSSGKVDIFFPYEPARNGGHVNEIKKRNIGLNLCRGHGCTYHMTMDSDEFYVTERLSWAYKQMKDSMWDASACKMQTYWKSPKFVLDPPEEYFVPLIYKVDDRMFDLRNRWRIQADPTRRLPSNRIREFERHEIEMHHLSYVRRDIGSKLRNSSARVNFEKKIPGLVEYFNGWQPGMPAHLAGMEDRVHGLKTVEPLFKTDEYEERS